MYGATLFGGYSSRCIVPSNQLRTIPKSITNAVAASIPAVAFTALHSLALAGLWKNFTPGKQTCILVHSASGGVGSSIVKMAKLLQIEGLVIVGVVGRDAKIDFCKNCGADIVVSKENNATSWVDVVRREAAGNGGYNAIFDANGLSTIQTSYDLLRMTGRLVIFGFASNIPQAKSFLSPLSWATMILGMLRMPTFDPMKLTLESKSVLGFNLSFFATEKELVGVYFEQIQKWLIEAKLEFDQPTVFKFDEIGKAHELIQSGRSVGKIVIEVIS